MNDFQPGFFHMSKDRITPVPYVFVPDWAVHHGRDLLKLARNIREGQHIYFELQWCDESAWRAAMDTLKRGKNTV